MKLKFLLFTLAAILFAACSNDDDKNYHGLSVNINYGTIATSNVKNLELTVTGNGVTKTATVTDFVYGKYFELADGNYTITATGKVKDNYRATIIGSKDIEVKGNTVTTIALDLDYDYILKTLTFDEDSWNALIDDPQYMGTQLYGTGYQWSDATTQLSHAEVMDDWGGYFWPAAFEAISNYYSTDTVANGDYTKQLTVFGTKAHSGNNCCVHFGYESYPGQGLASLKFSDGVARELESMYVNNTTYFLNVMNTGSGLSAKPTANDTVYVNLIGYNGETKTKELKIYLYLKGKAITDWTKVDLTPLGRVTEVKFDMGGTTKNGYGFAAPAYFAYDDVAVRFDK